MDIPARSEAIRQARDEGRRIAAVLPIHYPRALLRAFGFHPVEVWGPPALDLSSSASPFQEYICAIVRNATYFLGTPAASEVDCILIPHTCDSLQGMASVMQSFVRPRQPVLTLYHPRNREEAGLEFLTRELERLAARLREISDRDPTDDDLRAAIGEEAEADAVFADLCLQRSEYGLTDREFYTVLRSREYLSPRAFVEGARAVPRAGGAGNGGAEGGGEPVKLMLSGIVPEPMELFDHLQEEGARVVADDLACCSRRIYCDNDDPDPLRNMARRLLSMGPDSTAGASVEARNDHLLARMEATGARGLLVYGIKFCEPELFYLPSIQQALSERGLSMLHVEGELGPSVPGPVLNRIAAFVEVAR